jgi:hypothetical protein
VVEAGATRMAPQRRKVSRGSLLSVRACLGLAGFDVGLAWVLCVRAGGGGGGGGAEDGMYAELWNLCAGPLVTVPRVGDKVYYFPQGHIEQVRAPIRAPPPPSLWTPIRTPSSSRFLLCLRRSRGQVFQRSAR